MVMMFIILVALPMGITAFQQASQHSVANNANTAAVATKKAGGLAPTRALQVPQLRVTNEEHEDYGEAHPHGRTGINCPIHRRDMLFQTTGVASWAVWTALAFSQVPAVSAAQEVGLPPGAVVILGANGKTGSEVAEALAKQGRASVTLTRTGRDPFLTRQKLPYINFITHYPEPVSVTDLGAMKEAMDKLKPAAIVFCASASSNGGNAFAVDDQGVGNAAQVAKDANARFILVSALAVDRPNSKSFQMTNTLGGNFDGIMDAKLRGEERVRKTLKDYVIVRPGVLMGGKTTKLGATGVELNQGDYIGGGLSRDELAAVVVAALDSNIRGVTVEAYRKATRTKLQPDFPATSGNERTGATYTELFTTGGPLKVD
eukprot:CAMPEP_0198293940 /NCGR_PEP_ID=MMETSP1449-20131203/19673_1 /TAXON_ID=420275 /ORGANISM="Attheya septentrionalis, Strain CCMP2084" /LENGTH=373 /DNA_ID=CAMNT_0043993707 /DNA_START=58 /DNA_END=1176 /DNA_ORIENTATION=+